MTAASIDFDTAVLQELDFEFEQACESSNCDHGNPKATHYFRVSGICHPYDRLACEGCAKYMARLRQLLEMGIEFGCPDCHEGNDDAVIFIRTTEGN